MLIDTINERAVEIKQEGRFDTHAISPFWNYVAINEDGVCQSANRL